jgi:hypothetical protein
MVFLPRNSGTLSTCAVLLSWWRIYLSDQSSSLFLRKDSRNLLLLLVSHLIFGLSAPRFVLCPYLHLSFAFLAAHFLGHLAHLTALPWTAYDIQKHSVSSSVFNISQCRANITSTFANLHMKLDIYPLVQILVSYFSANSIPRTRTASSAAGEERRICL